MNLIQHQALFTINRGNAVSSRIPHLRMELSDITHFPSGFLGNIPGLLKNLAYNSS
jgi:hypothetical protein